MPTDNRRTDHIGDATEMVRTAREVAEEVAEAIVEDNYIPGNGIIEHRRGFVDLFADAIERGINLYLEENK